MGHRKHAEQLPLKMNEVLDERPLAVLLEDYDYGRSTFVDEFEVVHGFKDFRMVTGMCATRCTSRWPTRT